MIVGDTPDFDGDPVSTRGDNAAAVSRVNRRGGARDKRVGLLMIMLGRLQKIITDGGVTSSGIPRESGTL